MAMKVGKAALVLFFLSLPAHAQQVINYRSQQLGCAWLLGEVERMVAEKSWTMEEPSTLYKVVSFLKGALDIVGGQDEKEFIATVPELHPLSFSYRPADILEAMRYKGCVEEYGKAISFVRAGTLEADTAYKPKSRLTK